MLILWRFSRPHTIIGTAISIAVLYLLSGGDFTHVYWRFWVTLASALLCNVYITGYNQIVDIQIDKINKPYLPIASGELSIYKAKYVVWGSLLLSLLLGWSVSLFLGILVCVIAILGFFYSWKKVYFKRHHSTAALAITLVRGWLINLGFYIHFVNNGAHWPEIPVEIWLLVMFTTLFSLSIAWYKDIPDMEGDASAGIGSLVLKTGVVKTYKAGLYAVGTGYVAGAFAPFLFDFWLVKGSVICLGHAMLGLAFLSISGRVSLDDVVSVRKYYKTFWLFFFLEYLLFAGAYFA